MYSKTNLLSGKLPPLTDNLFLQFHKDIVSGRVIYQGADPFDTFKHMAKEYFLSSKNNTLIGLKNMPSTDIILGCHHFIDNLILKHGIDNLQIFEHDYKYYARLNPDISYVKITNLVPKKPLLIAAPFPGALDLHWNWSEILDECDQKQIPVHIDGAWLSSAKNINIDLTRPCIQSIGISLSKGLGLDWNRVGIRCSKTTDPTDSITIMNSFNMIPELLVRTGIAALQTVPVDYLWNRYGQQHQSICQELLLRPTNIIHAALSIDRKILYGLRDCFIKDSSL
jgi:hypothetical protein